MKITPSKHSRRFGISLIEVIACTAIVAVMVVPIASVIRASGQSIARSSVGSAEANVRGTMRWIRETIRTSTVLEVRANHVVVLMSTGNKATIELRRNALVLETDTSEAVLLENVNDVEFSEIFQSAAPKALIGISIRIRATDPHSGDRISRDSIVSIAPQV